MKKLVLVMSFVVVMLSSCIGKEVEPTHRWVYMPDTSIEESKYGKMSFNPQNHKVSIVLCGMMPIYGDYKVEDGILTIEVFNDVVSFTVGEDENTLTCIGGNGDFSKVYNVKMVKINS